MSAPQSPRPQHRLAASPAGFSALLGVAMAQLLPVASARADVGPHPSMRFTFELRISPVAIRGGELLQCEDAECTTSRPLEQLGPQRFECQADHCSSMAYGYSRYQKLVITFADRTRASAVFQSAASVPATS